MQQTKSYWRVVAVAGVLGMAVATACTVTTSTDDGVGGTGNLAGTTSSTAGATSTAGTGGSATAGTSGSTSVAGSTSTAGTGGSTATSFQCDQGDGTAVVGTPASCEATAGNTCSECTHDHCCTEFSNCYATNPGNTCGYGGPSGDGSGEIACVQACIIAATSDGGVADDDTIATCGGNCVTPKDTQGTACGALGARTSELVGCLKDNCLTECFGG